MNTAWCAPGASLGRVHLALCVFLSPIKSRGDPAQAPPPSLLGAQSEQGRDPLQLLHGSPRLPYISQVALSPRGRKRSLDRAVPHPASSCMNYTWGWASG